MGMNGLNVGATIAFLKVKASERAKRQNSIVKLKV